MRRLLTLLGTAVLVMGLATAPASATTTRIAIHCEETIVLPGWTGTSSITSAASRPTTPTSAARTAPESTTRR
jgi:hypothetical protein